MAGANVRMVPANVTMVRANVTMIPANVTMVPANVTVVPANVTVVSANVVCGRPESDRKDYPRSSGCGSEATASPVILRIQVILLV